MIDYFLSPQFVEALGWTLLHSLWQGAGFAILLAVIFIALRSYTAQSRYIVATGLLTAFFITVAATFWMQWQNASNRIDMVAEQQIAPQTEAVMALDTNSSTAANAEIVGENAPSLQVEKETASSTHWLSAFSDYYERHLPLLVTFWLLGVLFLQLRFLGQLAYVQRLKHYGTELFPESWTTKIEELEGKLRIQKKVNYLTSIRIESPMVIGWLKPVVLFPRHIFKSLSETEIYAVLAHELAHIRREDFVVNLMQTLLCNVFFFHPGVWWMSSRVDDEREHCCDDLAVAATGQAVSYAKTLINVSELQLNRQGNPELAVAFSGKSKKRDRGGFAGRIRRLFNVTNVAGTYREGFATACILFAGLFFGVIATGHTVQSTDSTASSSLEETNISGINETIRNDHPNFSPKTNGAISPKTNSTISPKTNSTISTKTNSTISTKTNNTITTITTNSSESAISQISSISDVYEDCGPVVAPSNPVATAIIESIAHPFVPVQSVDTRIDALVTACAEGDFEFVQTLIKAGINVNGIGSKGFTPLMMAASENNVEVVEYLLAKGADVNQVSGGWTALIEAADEGSLESMEVLLREGAKVNYYAGHSSPTAITMAASEGYLDCLKMLLQHGAAINGFEKSVPPLHIAAEEDKRSIIDFLIAQKVKINQRDASGRTALMYAASEGHVHTVKKLIDAGADISIVDLDGASAKNYAQKENSDVVLDYLGAEKRPAIHQATLDGLIEKVERMVKKGTDVNSRDSYGRTPLHIAAAENHNIDMEVLFNLGADIDAQDSQGRTPLMYAAADGKDGAVSLLVANLADVNIQDVDGMRALEWARNSGNSDLTSFLRLITEKKSSSNKNLKEPDMQYIIEEALSEKGIQKEIEKRIEIEVQKAMQKETQLKVDVQVTRNGSQVKEFDQGANKIDLIEAARNGSIADCRQLLSKGADINATDNTGQTAVMIAAMTDQINLTKFLIERGADVNRSSNSGLTALHYAALENHYEIAYLLLEGDAKVDATMRYSSTDGSNGKKAKLWEYIGATPLLIGVESGNLEVVALLIKAGANPNHTLTKNEYGIKKGHETYLTLSEVVGFDEDFLNNSQIIVSDDEWSPYKQAKQMNDRAILALFPQ